MELRNLRRKVDDYNNVLQNTITYRETWKATLKDFIISHLEELSEEVKLDGKIEVKSQLENLDAVVFSLGDVQSGMYQEVNSDIKRHLIKHNGSLVYQQLFNGKVIVVINYPFIENYGQPHPPKTLAIYRPEEIKEPFILRHMEEFVTEITAWEDYDDDKPSDKSQRIGFKLNFETPDEEA